MNKQHQNTIVLAADDPPALEAVVTILKGQGYTVRCASDGPDGPENAGQIRPDLILRMEKSAEVEKLNGVLETAGGVCHSLNQPLQYVLGAVQILLMDMSPEDKMYQSLDKIREKMEQMGTITRKLAEVTRYRTPPQADGQHILDMDKCPKKK